MPADTEPLDAELLRKRAIQLRAFIDQDPDEADTDDDGEVAGVVNRVFTHDELDAIEENHDKVAVALARVDADYARFVEASAALEASQDALDAHVVVVVIEEQEDQAERDDEALGDPPEDESYDGDGEDHVSKGEDDEEHDPDDPDADLED